MEILTPAPYRSIMDLELPRNEPVETEEASRIESIVDDGINTTLLASTGTT